MILFGYMMEARYLFLGAECEVSPSVEEIPRSTEKKNKVPVNQFIGNELDDAITTVIEPTVAQELPTHEIFNDVVSSEGIMDEGVDDIAALLFNHGSLVADDLIRESLVFMSENYILVVDLPFEASKGQKRSFEQSLGWMENENSSELSNYVPLNDFEVLKKQCVVLEDRLKKLEEESSGK